MSKYTNNIEEISRLSMTERLERWKQARADKERVGAPSSGSKKALYDRFHKVSSALDEALGSVSDRQNDNPNKLDEQKAQLKSKVKRRTSGSLEGKPVLHNLSPSGAVEPLTKETRRRSSLGSTGSSGGKKKKGSSRRSSSGSSPKVSAKKHAEAIEALEASKEEEIRQLKASLTQANLDKEDVKRRNEQLLQQLQATWDEIQRQFFLNGVQEQEISSLRGDLSIAQLESAEGTGDRRRFRSEKKRLDAENAQLREMGQELSEQLEQMNDMAQARFTELEQEVGEKQKEIDSLHSQVSAMRLSQVQSRIEAASAEVKLHHLRRSSGGSGSGRCSTSSGSATDEAPDLDVEEEEGYDTE